LYAFFYIFFKETVDCKLNLGLGGLERGDGNSVLIAGSLHLRLI